MEKSNVLRLLWWEGGAEQWVRAAFSGSGSSHSSSSPACQALCRSHSHPEPGLMKGEPLHRCFCPWLCPERAVPGGNGALCAPAPSRGTAALIFVLGRAARQNLWVQNTQGTLHC